MAIRPNAEENEVLEFISSAESGEVTGKQVAEHFRGVKTSTKVLNLLDALYQKGWLTKRWPNWYCIRRSEIVNGVSDKGGTS